MFRKEPYVPFTNDLQLCIRHGWSTAGEPELVNNPQLFQCKVWHVSISDVADFS